MNPKPRVPRVCVLLLAASVAGETVAQTPVAKASVPPAVSHAPAIAPSEGQETAGKTPTFAKDVVPILQRSCQACHRPGSIAPMALITYEQTRPWAAAIRKRVVAREMPPWFIDRNVGITRFKNDISLSDAEVATIVNWVDGGAPPGNPSEMPPPLKFPDPTAWQIGKPDLIVEMKEPMMVKAAAPDWWGDIVVETPAVTEDRWVKAVEIKPVAGYKVVHHSGAFQVYGERPGGESSADSLLSMYTVGKNGDVSPEGVGRLLKAGSKIRFNFHVHSNGEETAVRMGVGFQFYPKGYIPKYAMQTDVWGGDYEQEFELPAGAANVRSDGYGVLTKPAVITQFEPHMHNRGKAMCLELIYPQETLPASSPGKPASLVRRHPSSTYSKHAVDTEVVSCVDRFNFGWLRAYTYEDDVAPVVPAGTILHLIMWHDNSPATKGNYDSTNWIGWGQRSIDEMNHAWMGYYYISEEEYQQRMAARRAKTADKTGAATPAARIVD